MLIIRIFHHLIFYMKYFCSFILLLFGACLAVSAQTGRRLIDSARSYKSSDYAKVISFANTSYKQAIINKQPALAGESAMMLGEGNYLAGNYKEALRWYFESEKLYNSINDKKGLAELYAEMCVFYVKNKAFKDADSVSKKSIAYSATLNNLNQLASSTNNRGLMFMDSGKIDSAVSSFQSAFNLYKKLKDKVGMAYSLDYLSSALSERGSFTKALQVLNESKALRQGMGDKTAEAIAINNIGELYLKEKKPAEAAPFFALAIAKAHELKYPDLEIYAYSMLTQTYQQQMKFREAYQAQAKYLELNQKFEGEKNTKALQELQTKYETNKKEQQNKLLKEENRTQLIKLSRNRIGIYALLTITVLIIILFYLLYNRYKLKQQTRFDAAMLEEQRLRSQGIMDAEENERQRLARELHDGVGQMLCAARRQVELNDNGKNEETLKMLDESITEVRDISHTMVPPSILNKSLQQAIEELINRMNNKNQVSIHTNWINTDGLELDKTTTLMLYRGMQEIISNIFRHSGATIVNIEMVNHFTDLTLMIYDDGIGFDKEKLLQTGKGLGLKNIQSRIAYIGGSLQIDTIPSKGVTYTIELPLTLVAQNV